MGSRLKIGHVILIFALTALPFAATYALYYPDERHYTDGAMLMLQHGHWFTPENADGTPRFEKPPLAYWAVAASWLLSGVSTLTARLPFLVAGCGTLLLTFRIAKRMTGDEATAVLAAVILAAHPQFFLGSIRSMPDALLTFFITLSGIGFLRLIVWEERTNGAFWMAYGGAAGAALSKGMLGVCMVGFAWAFAFSARRDWRDVARIIHWPSVAMAVAATFGWVGYIVATHGTVAWFTFFGDQVTDNLDGYFWSPVWRAPLFALILTVNFLPWSLPLVESAVRKEKWPAGPVPPTARKFILGWTGFLIVIFSLGSNLSMRYLLPATPLVSVLLAAWLRDADSQSRFFSLSRMFKAVLVILFLVTAAAFVIEWQWQRPLFILVPAFALFGMGIVLLWKDAARKLHFSTAEALGLVLVFGWLMVAAGLIPPGLPDRSQQIAAALVQLPLGATKPVLLVGDRQLASNLRVTLGKKWVIAQADQLTPAMTLHYTRFLLNERDARALAARGWPMQLVATFPARLPPYRELIRALKTHSLPATVSRYGERTYLYFRN